MKQKAVPNATIKDTLVILHSQKKEYIRYSCKQFAATQDDASEVFDQAVILYMEKKEAGKLEKLVRSSHEYIIDLADRILVIKLIKEGNERVLDRLYYTYHKKFCIWMIKKFSLNKEDAKDVFQDTILAFHTNIVTEKLVELTTSIESYLWQIAKHKSINLIKKEQTRHKHKDYIAGTYDENNNTIYQPLLESQSRLVTILNRWPNRSCAKLLKMFYWKRFCMEAIARELDLKNADSAKTKKNTCQKKLEAYLVKIDYKN